MVDVIFADVAQPDQTRIVALNAHTFLRNGGHFMISIKVRASCLLSVTAEQPVETREAPSLLMQSNSSSVSTQLPCP